MTAQRMGPCSECGQMTVLVHEKPWNKTTKHHARAEAAQRALDDVRRNDRGIDVGKITRDAFEAGRKYALDDVRAKVEALPIPEYDTGETVFADPDVVSRAAVLALLAQPVPTPEPLDDPNEPSRAWVDRLLIPDEGSTPDPSPEVVK